MDVNLQLLGITAIPRLPKRFGIPIEFPEERTLSGITRGNFERAVEDSRKILDTFFKKFNVSWWDVYCDSDIGMEQLALAREMLLRIDDVVVDVGCGRGYFSIAVAKLSKRVVGLDLMNGVGRHGWWTNFRTAMHEPDLCERVLGIKADAIRIIFKESSFTVAAAVHSIRDIQNKNSIEKALEEMKRVAAKRGSVRLQKAFHGTNERSKSSSTNASVQGEIWYGGNELFRRG